MQQELINYINAQRAEAIEFSKQPDCWMGMMVDPADTAYWSQRVPSGTLAEFERIELEESAYYATADAYSKSYARSFDFSTMSDAQLEAVITEACNEMDYQHKAEVAYKKAEELKMTELANSLNVDMNTLNRWMEAA
tara:strand:+ start:273 stop:683 length:411 start_codon:yes stop_codon:yes gene_type:complete